MPLSPFEQHYKLLLGGIELTQTKARNWYHKTLLGALRTHSGASRVREFVSPSRPGLLRPPELLDALIGRWLT